MVLATSNEIGTNYTLLDNGEAEAFGDEEVKWESILGRAKKMSGSKAWRFSSEAMDKFEGEEKFLSRQLSDTSYLSKVAKSYLSTIIPDNKIVVTTGRLTSLVRAKLGLNEVISDSYIKNRNDHRHHAIDALIVSLIDRSFLNESAEKLSKSAEKSRDKIKFQEPWIGFFETVKEKVKDIVVSHKVDHGANKAFCEQTGFGLHNPKNEYEEEKNFKLITTKHIKDLKDKDIEKIVSTKFREIAIREIAKKTGIDSLKSYGVKKLKIFEVCKEDINEIGQGHSSYMLKVSHGKNKEHHVYYKKGTSYALCLWRVPEANKGDTISPVFIHRYDYLKYKGDLNFIKPHPAAKLLCKVSNGDTVIFEKDGKETLYLIKSLVRSSKRVHLLEIEKAIKGESDKQITVAVSKFKVRNFRKVRVTVTGRVLDGGPIL